MNIIVAFPIYFRVKYVIFLKVIFVLIDHILFDSIHIQIDQFPKDRERCLQP